MRLKIAPERYISDIQKEFNEVFPFLKLSFFKQKNASSSLANSLLLTGDKKMGEFYRSLTSDFIQIEEVMQVKEVEKMFKDKFNIEVKIFRKSGNLWLETTMTDDWSLLQQNNHGREISSTQPGS